MASESGGFRAFMAKDVPVKRSDFYLLRFLFFFAWMVALGTIGRAGVAMSLVVIALATAILISALSYWTDRYGRLSDRIRIVLSLIVLTVLTVLIWRHETHKPDTSKPFIPDSSVIHSN